MTCSFLSRKCLLAVKGTHDGRPRYVERNKENGGAYTQVIPAEIIYCKKIDAWVFRHENIRTSLNDDYEVTSLFLSLSRLGQY